MIRPDQTCIKTIERKVNLLQICLLLSSSSFYSSSCLAERGRIVKLDRGRGREGFFGGEKSEKPNGIFYAFFSAVRCDLPSAGNSKASIGDADRVRKKKEGDSPRHKLS